MLRPFTIALAAAALLGAGALGGAALTARPAAIATTPPSRRPLPVEVRTQVIHRTVRIVRHVHRRHGPTSAPPKPVVSRAPAAPQQAPLRTSSSSTGRHGGGDGADHESEGADD